MTVFMRGAPSLTKCPAPTGAGCRETQGPSSTWAANLAHQPFDRVVGPLLVAAGHHALALQGALGTAGDAQCL